MATFASDNLPGRGIEIPSRSRDVNLATDQPGGWSMARRSCHD
jgi:hypothetical protein